MRSMVYIALLVGVFVAFRIFSDPSSHLPPHSAARPQGSEAPKPPPKSEISRPLEPVLSAPRRDRLQRAPAVASSPPEVRASGGRLSLDVTDKPLKSLLDEVYQQSGIAIVLADEIPDSNVSLRFDDYPIERGLHRLLDGYDSFFLFSPMGGGTARLTTVWVYPKGRGQGLAPIPSPFEAHSNELQRQAASPDVLQRASATASLIERNGNEALEIAKTALTDPDEQVRIQALDAALRASVDLAPDLLKEVAQHDPSPTVRAMALVGLTGGDRGDASTESAVWDLLEAAMQDPAPEVSDLANQLAETRSNIPEQSEEAGDQGEQQAQLP